MLYLLYKKFNLEQVAGIEPAPQPWQGRVLADILYLHNVAPRSGFFGMAGTSGS